MYRFIVVVLAFVACSSAKPALIAPLTYGTPLYAGTSQVDIRNSYNGGIATSLGYGSALAARYAAAPLAYTAPIARYASPAIAAPVARYASPLAAAAYAASIAPYAASYSPYAASYVSPYASAFGAPYTLAAPAGAPVLL